MRRVWGWEFGDESTVTVHVRRLREKVEDYRARPRHVGGRIASTPRVRRRPAVRKRGHA